MAGLFTHKRNAIIDTNILNNLKGISDFSQAYNDKMTESIRNIDIDVSTPIPHCFLTEISSVDIIDGRSPQQRAEDLRFDPKTGQYYLSNERVRNSLPELIRPTNYKITQNRLSYETNKQNFHNNSLINTVDSLHAKVRGDFPSLADGGDTSSGVQTFITEHGELM